MARRKITAEDHRDAVGRLLVGMAAGQDVVELSASVADLHPKNDTFPGEAYMRLASEVLADSVAAGVRVEYEGLRERHLVEIEFRGRRTASSSTRCCAAPPSPAASSPTCSTK